MTMLRDGNIACPCFDSGLDTETGLLLNDSNFSRGTINNFGRSEKKKIISLVEISLF